MSRDADTVVGALVRHALERPEARAVVSEHRTLAYGELAAIAGACAVRLAAQGIERGECVGITVADEIAHAIVALGLVSLGAAFIVLPTFEGESARSRLAARVSARRVVAARPEHRLPGLTLVSLDTVLPGSGEAGGARLSARDDPSALLTYFSTSGTTGEAKLIPVEGGRLALQALRIPAVCTMPLSSLEHHYATRMLLCMIARGASIAVRDRSRTPVARLCAALGVEVVLGMPAQARALMGDAARDGRLPAGTTLRTAGARTSARFRRDVLTQLCDEFDVLYAAQECGQIAHRVESDPEHVRESLGSLRPGVEVVIVDERGRALPPGEIGQIRIRAPGMANGYHDDAAATARHFRDGWFQPGDAASISEDGELSVYGRADDVMNMNGIKIAPLEIERVLERHPAVKAVVAFPLRSPVHGDVPVAAVEIADGALVDERELRAFARQALGLRAPRRVTIVAELPSTAHGKVDLMKLAATMPPEPER